MNWVCDESLQFNKIDIKILPQVSKYVRQGEPKGHLAFKISVVSLWVCK